MLDRYAENMMAFARHLTGQGEVGRRCQQPLARATGTCSCAKRGRGDSEEGEETSMTSFWRIKF